MKSLLIPSKTWQNYIKKLAKIDTKAAADVVAYMTSHDAGTEAGAKALVDYAYAVSTKYGEAAAELTCQMYDAIAYVSKAAVPAAEPAATATFGEIAKTVYGTLASTKDPDAVGAAVGRSVKLASVDTLQQNALRDGAEWAWIPSGDSCPFCIMLASRGWEPASSKAIKNGHAEHIHNNCDCNYCVRFDSETTVAGYGNGEEYLDIYEQQKGIDQNIIDELKKKGYDLNTPKGRMAAMRRQHYANNRDYINAQKRAAYAARMERQRGKRSISTVVDKEHIESQSYRMQFHGVTGDAKVDDRICDYARNILDHRTGTEKEDLVLLDAQNGNLIHLHNRSTNDGGVAYDEAIENAIQEAHEKGQRIVAIHNHPNSYPPTMDDGASAFDHDYDIGVVVCHDGSVYQYTKTDGHYEIEDCEKVHAAISYQIETGAKLDEVWYNMLKEYGMTITRR